MISTVNPQSQKTFFKTVYRETLKGRGQFKTMFIPWNVVPGRNQKWLDKVCDTEYSNAGMSKALYRSSQYPETETEALSPPSSIAAFEVTNLQRMRNDVEKPREKVGPINYYREFCVGHTYVAFTDTSEGTGRDNACTVVMDFNTGIIVADILSRVLNPETLAYHSYQMLEKYHFPLWGIESNKRGIICVNAAVDMGYPNLFYQDWQTEYKRDDSKKTKPGWNTGPVGGSTKHRIILWEEGVAAVDRGDVRILNAEGLEDFFSVIRDPENNGRIEGISGTNDDYPFAVCGAWQMTKFIRKSTEWDKTKRSTANPFRMVAR
jgi:hypothetical protein